uniref:NVL2 nucleolin binding domain-containing protein n=1 Tax=Plectus sambesii TaxID=2011161 RepID=A0A914WAY2_9BILA
MRAEADKIGFISDPKLVPRIRQLVEADTAQPYLDAEEIATSLQGRYPEYARKKRRAFVQLVQRALDRLGNDPAARFDRT